MISLDDLDQDTLTWEMLGAYEIAPGYNEWCALIGLTSTDEAADQAFTIIHNAYAALWSSLGELFFVRLEVFADRWRSRVAGSGRTGNRTLVARLLGR